MRLIKNSFARLMLVSNAIVVILFTIFGFLFFNVVFNGGINYPEIESVKKSYMLRAEYFEHSVNRMIQHSIYESHNDNAINVCNRKGSGWKHLKKRFSLIKEVENMSLLIISIPQNKIYSSESSDSKIIDIKLRKDLLDDAQSKNKKTFLYTQRGNNIYDTRLWVISTISDKNKIIGAVCIGKYYYELLKYKNAIFDMPTEVVYILDNASDIQFSSPYVYLNDDEKNIVMDEITKPESVASDPEHRIIKSKIHSYYAFQYEINFNRTGIDAWKNVWVINEIKLFNNATKNVVTHSIILIMLFLMMFISNGVVYIMIYRPLKYIMVAAEKIAENEFDIEMPSSKGEDIIALSNAIIKIRDNMRGYHEHLETIISSRTHELELALSQLHKRESTLNKEMQFASSIQVGLMPLLEKWQNLSFAFDINQLEGIGGDIIDIIDTDDFTLVYLADISGHGIPAALISMLVKLAFLHSVQKNQDIISIISEVNERINSLVSRKEIKYINYFTVFTLLFRKDSTFEYLSAGHIPGIIYRNSSRSCELFSTQSSMIGLFDSDIVKFYSENGVLQSGDRIILCSDGIINSRNRSQVKYGYERLIGLIKTNPSVTPEELKQILCDDFNLFMKDSEAKDDMSFLIIQRTD